MQLRLSFLYQGRRRRIHLLIFVLLLVAIVYRFTSVFSTVYRAVLRYTQVRAPPTFYTPCGSSNPPRPLIHRPTFTVKGRPICDWSQSGAPSSLLLTVMISGDRFEKRSIIRNTYPRDARSSTRVVFALGRLDRLLPEQRRRVWDEYYMYGDILLLDVDENGDSGKTYHTFETVSRLFSHCPFTYVAKVDDDAWFHMPHVQLRLDALVPFAQEQGVYYGALHDWPKTFHYMTGMITGLSWNLVQWIGKDPWVESNKGGPEDWMTGTWVQEFGRRRAMALPTPNPALPFHNDPLECPHGEGYPHYHCEPREDLWDWEYHHEENFVGWNTTSVIGMHNLKTIELFCDADTTVRPR
ncbi:hypothetical protein HKX48_004214 [Thoreauomyces humboldtii]|nr:hypothetical protein HKX48_004214 [Thoreauomyces humboldtii]